MMKQNTDADAKAKCCDCGAVRKGSEKDCKRFADSHGGRNHKVAVNTEFYK